MGSVSDAEHSRESRSGCQFPDFLAALRSSFVIFIFVFGKVQRPLRAVVLRLWRVSECAKSGRVRRLERSNLDPISNICPLSAAERMPSYANFDTGLVKPFLICICFLFVFFEHCGRN